MVINSTANHPDERPGRRLPLFTSPVRNAKNPSISHAHTHIPAPDMGRLFRRGPAQHSLHLFRRPRASGDISLWRALPGHRSNTEHRPLGETGCGIRALLLCQLDLRSVARLHPHRQALAHQRLHRQQQLALQRRTADIPQVSASRPATKPPSSASGISSAIPPASTTGRSSPARAVTTIRTSSRWTAPPSASTATCSDIITDKAARLAEEPQGQEQALRPDGPAQGPAPQLGACRTPLQALRRHDHAGAGNPLRRLREPQ